MNKAQILELINHSLSHLWWRDKLLFEFKVKEECLNHRLAFYFENLYEIIKHDELFYQIDLEYNKNISLQKKQITINDIPENIRPDIIIHQRKSHTDNLLACECKMQILRERDKIKLISLLREPFNYKYTAGIIYHPNQNHFNYTLFYLTNGTIQKENFVVQKGN